MNKMYQTKQTVQTNKVMKAFFVRYLMILALLFSFARTAEATDYVFTYNGGYLAVNNSGDIVYTNTFSPQCVWTCVSNTSNLTPASLQDGNTLYWLTTIDAGGTRRWLVGSTTNGTAISTSTSAGTAYWRTDGSNYLIYRNGYSYYAYYRGSQWRTSRSTGNNNNGYQGTVYGATNYRCTYTTVTISTVDGSSTAPTVSGNDIITSTTAVTYTASGAAYQQGGYTNYYFNRANHYFNGNTSITPATATISGYSWSISSDADVTASGTTATGTITVNTLPESDMPATITVTVTFTGGTPTVDANTTLTASKEIIIQGTKPTAPIISVSGTTATLSTTAVGSTTIRYTLDGTDPTASTGTVYSGAIDLSGSSTSPVTIKAITVRSGNASDVSTETVTLTLPAPTITANASAGTATISATAGATIYYTTDGSAPTTSSSSYSGSLSGLAMMTTIKAIAVKDGWNNSPVASELVTLPSSVSADTVTLFDYEDHNWSYYQASGDLPTGYPDKLHSPDPRNVKITYRGGSVSGASAVAISALDGEGQNTMIYYKTLEKSVPGMTGDYPYTVISNPFSKRPKLNTTYYGFAGWKVISGGEYISEYADNAVLPLDTTIHFTGLDNNYTPNCTSAEVIFEATWTEATVKTGDSNPDSWGDGNYETRFWVLSGNSDINNISVPSGITVSARYPDGTENYTRSLTGTITAGGNNAKLEFVKVNSTGAVSAAGYTFTLGRGIVNSGNGGALYGATSAPSSSFNFKVESGKYSLARLFSSTNQVSSAITVNVTYGCDYDRASNNPDSKLTINGQVNVGYGSRCTSSSTKINVKALSGTFGSSTTAGDEEFYMGFANVGGQSPCTRYLEVLGGTFRGGIAGGIEANGTGIAATTDVVTMRIKGGTVHQYVYGAGQYSPAYGTRTTIITGGTFNCWVAVGAYGTSNAEGNTNGNTRLYVGGKAKQTSTAGIYGGGYGTSAWNGNEKYNVRQTTVVIADEAQIAGSVFGGGNNGYATGAINVYVLGSTVSGDVYGGANMAPSNNTVDVIMKGGKVEGDVYGGSNQKGNISGAVAVKVYGGTVKGAVYGCNNAGDAPQSTVTVDIYGTDPAPSADSYALGAVFGGGNAADYNGTPVVTVHNCDNSIEYVYGGGNAARVAATDVTIYGGNVIGNVFGGGNGTVTAANVTGNTLTKIYGGTILKVFGGSNSQGTIGGTITVNAASQTESGTNPITGTAFERCPINVDELYGGGNEAGSNVGNISIGCMNDGDMINYVYGGSNNAPITGNINLTMTGGRIGNLFGGNNTGSTISGNIAVTVNWNGSCSNNYLGNVFGGGNLATIGTAGSPKAPTVKILNGTVSGNVYGGGKGLASDHTKGQVTGNPIVLIGDDTAGHESRVAVVTGDVYGGGDAGNVVGTPQVTVANKCNTEVGYVYGGGNAADVNGTNVSILGGVIHNDVFGGGHGDKASLGNDHSDKVANVNGNTTVSITGGTIGRVFAGSNINGTISGSNCTLTINKSAAACPMKIGEVYGGGNMADGNATTILVGCTGTWTTSGTNNHTNANETDNRIGYELEGIGTVYGGANQANIGTAQNNSNITLNINSGMVNRVFGGNNTSGTINGTIAVNINKTSDACSWYVGDVFGGGNLAAYSGSPTVTLTAGTVSGNIYGGGNEAGVGGSTVNINGGAMTAGKGIYGGCNTSGTVTGNIAVNINGGTLGTSGDGNALYGIFGGGYGASTATEGNVTVTIGDDGGTKVPTIYGDIYGGSALGSVNNEASDLTKIDFLNGTLHGNIYGGGLGDAGDASKGWVNGEVQVNISSETQTQANCHIDLRAADIYGCNNTNGSPQADVTVHIWKTGYVTGDYSAQTGSRYAIDEVFGGGNQADYAPENGDPDSDKKATVYVHDCLNSIRRLFGGGNKAAATGIATTIDGGRFEYVFGGGNGEVGAADVGLGGTNLTVHSGRIAHLFGGSNTRGTISGPMLVSVDYEKMGVSGCDEQIGEFFGGGNEAVLGDAENPVNLSTTIACNTIFTDVYGGSNLAAIYGNVTLTVNGGTIQNLYGGSKGAVGTAANITGNVKLNIYGGDIERAYGGSNINGDITGTIGVDLDWSQSVCSQKEIDYIYGGSNQTAYTPTNASGISPDVKLINGTVNERVYGGGRGSSAVVTSNPRVTAGAAGKNVVVLGSIFGGGDAAQVTGSTDVSVIHSAIVGSMAGGEGNIFGGGNAADVTGNTKVYLGNRAKIYGNVYGGGNQGEVDGDTKVIVNSD